MNESDEQKVMRLEMLLKEEVKEWKIIRGDANRTRKINSTLVWGSLKKYRFWETIFKFTLKHYGNSDVEKWVDILLSLRKFIIIDKILFFFVVVVLFLKKNRFIYCVPLYLLSYCHYCHSSHSNLVNVCSLFVSVFVKCIFFLFFSMCLKHLYML